MILLFLFNTFFLKDVDDVENELMVHFFYVVLHVLDVRKSEWYQHKFMALMVKIPNSICKGFTGVSVFMHQLLELVILVERLSI